MPAEQDRAGVAELPGAESSVIKNAKYTSVAGTSSMYCTACPQMLLLAMSPSKWELLMAGLPCMSTCNRRSKSVNNGFQELPS